MPVATRRRQKEQRQLATEPVSGSLENMEKLDAKLRILPRQTTPSKKKRSASIDAGSNSLPVVSPEKPPTLDDSTSALVSATRPKEKKSKQSKNQSQQATTRLKSPSPPQNWQEIYSLVEELRLDRTAPCDTMGCEALAVRDESNLSSFRFHALVALLLSSQTKDAMVSEAIQFMKHDGILSVEALQKPEITEQILSDKYLARVGFRHNKAKYLKQVVDILHQEYAGDIPPTAAKMMELPGIGPKMAFICESVAWDPPVPSGIGVDTHMHRLFNQLGWVKSTTPEQTRVQLESWLPLEKWKTVNLLWVGFGQEVQQEKSKILNKALQCSEPANALRLLQKCGVDLKKEGAKHGLEQEIKAAMSKTDEEI